jgi:hypothetical protein
MAVKTPVGMASARWVSLKLKAYSNGIYERTGKDYFIS